MENLNINLINDRLERLENAFQDEHATISINFNEEKRLLQAKFISDNRCISAYESSFEDVVSSLSSAVEENKDSFYECEANDELYSCSLDEKLHNNMELRFVSAFGGIIIMSAQEGKDPKSINCGSSLKAAISISYSI